MSVSPASSNAAPNRMLRLVLALDSVGMSVIGLAYLLASNALAQLFGLNNHLLLGVGVFMLAIAVVVGYLASRPNPADVVVAIVIAIGAAWVVLSLIVYALGWLQPSTVGEIWIIVQAVPVTVLASLQHIGLLRRRRLVTEREFARW